MEENNNINIDKNNFIFVNYISGIKGIPLRTAMVVVNDTPSKSLNFTYNIDGNKIMKFPINSITNISFKSRVQMQTNEKKVEETEVKSNLLAAALFGGNPLAQVAGGKGINNLLNSLSDNYNKIDYSTYYEINIEILLNDQNFKILLNCDTNPEEFINNLKTTT